MSKTERDKFGRLMFAGRWSHERQAARAKFAELLAATKHNRTYLRDYTTWAAYIRGRFGRSRRWADKLIRDHGLSTAPTRLKYGEGVQIGRALAKVQRTRSYRATHSSFAAYVRECYDRPVGWAYRRIIEHKALTE